jgi:hydroxyacylglutathione hydrolase
VPALEIRRVPAFLDNYLWLVHAPETGETAVVDPGDAHAIDTALREAGWSLTHILVTHHHLDHVGGVSALKARWGAVVVGPRRDAERIPSLDEPVGDGDTVSLGGHTAQVFDVPGHTRGHIAYWFTDDAAAFVGDTLFAAGCGRMFEGTPEQFWSSLGALRRLPDETRVYCAHEYTESNLRFACSVFPDHAALAARAASVQAARARGEATVPSTMAEERATNPFLWSDDPAVATHLGLAADAPPSAVFAELRGRKDRF